MNNNPIKNLFKYLLKVYFSFGALFSTTSVFADRPNIVLIMADDLGFSDLGCYGSEIQTPISIDLQRMVSNLHNFIIRLSVILLVFHCLLVSIAIKQVAHHCQGSNYC